jgi:F-type H+-transporting ATPase subunit gamma
MRRVVAGVVAGSGGVSHRYLGVRRVRRSVVVAFCGDRGLCGGYNVNVCKAARALMKSKRDDGVEVSVVTIGSKARDYFVRRREHISDGFTGVSENPSYAAAAEIGEKLLAGYSGGEIDEIILVHTEFKSAIKHEVKLTKLLPANDIGTSVAKVGYDSSPEVVIDYIMPKYINTVIYRAMLESTACEQGARMTAMKSATDNADEMINKLTLSYNRARQSAITQEITEIVSGAGASEAAR